MKNQFKKADKSGAKLALVIGESEAETHTVNLKALRKELVDQKLGAQQQNIKQEEALIFVTNLLDSL